MNNKNQSLLRCPQQYSQLSTPESTVSRHLRLDSSSCLFQPNLVNNHLHRVLSQAISTRVKVWCEKSRGTTRVKVWCEKSNQKIHFYTLPKKILAKLLIVLYGPSKLNFTFYCGPNNRIRYLQLAFFHPLAQLLSSLHLFLIL